VLVLVIRFASIAQDAREGCPPRHATLRPARRAVARLLILEESAGSHVAMIGGATQQQEYSCDVKDDSECGTHPPPPVANRMHGQF